MVGNQIVVGGQFGEVYSLDAETGCIQWTYEGEAAVKGVVAIAPPNAQGGRIAVAADFRTNVVALDLATGKCGGGAGWASTRPRTSPGRRW